jgi:signal transduction histidine kinase/ActR/RegA family two-component response regulator
MTFQPNPSAIPFIVAAIVSGVLAVFAWRRRGLAMASAFALMMTGETAWALFEALELVFVEMPAKQAFFELRVAGAVTAILGLLAVVLRYTGHVEWLKLPVFTAICTPAVVMILFAWTNDRHHFYWYDHVPVTLHEFAFTRPVYGPAFWVHFTYCYGLVAASTILLAQAVVTSAGVYRIQAAVMLFGVILPWVVNMIDMSHVLGVMYTDTAAMTFAVTGLAFLPAVLRYRLLELTPVAWATVVGGMNDPVVVIDPSGRIVELNEIAQRLSGRPLAAILGFDIAQTFSRWPELAQQLRVMPEQGESSFELPGPESDPSSAFDARISRLGGPGELLGWVVVLRDITAHKRAAEERVRMLFEQSARAEAEAANRAKDRFLATLSHELRTPLTPVLASVTAMLGDAATPESLRSVLEMIRRNISLEARLIDDLLDLARIRRGGLDLKREVLDAHELIKQVIAICEDDFRRAGIELGLELAAACHHVDADPIRFQQALWNLIKNAIKFTPAGGRVSVRTDDRQISPASSGGVLVVQVSDTGIGIEAGMIDRIFDVAQQGGTAVTRRFGGLGLGLTLSRSIIEQHGGRLTASSAGPGAGATFTIEIFSVPAPAMLADGPPAIADSSELSTSPAPRPLRILLVEDNEDTLRFLSTMLSRRGYEVATAGDLAEALRLAFEGEPDLLISDIELPDGNGLELMDAIRSRRPMPGIALSGFGSADDIEQSLASGFNVHLTKPVDFRRLEEVIQQIAGGAESKSLVSP